MIDPAWQTARRILVVRLDNLGDVLVTTPAIHAVKAALPDAAITLYASPVGAQVGRLNPDISAVIAWDAPWIDPWRTLPHDSAREQRMIERLRGQQFDGAIIFTSYRQSALPAAYHCYLADIPLRAAASLDGAGSLLTTRLKRPEALVHEVERGLDLVAALGMPPADTHLVLRVPDDARAALQAVMLERDMDKRPLVVVHPGCTMPARTYPWEQYAEVVELLTAVLGATVALTGAASERELVEQIATTLSPAARAQTQTFAGDLAFPAFCALIDIADLTITNNTGPMHIAAALQTPVVALFALTNPPEQWGPWQVPHRLLNHDVACRICYSRVCPHGHECLRLVTPEMVVDAAEELLARPHPPTPSPSAMERGRRPHPPTPSPLAMERGRSTDDGEERSPPAGGNRARGGGQPAGKSAPSIWKPACAGWDAADRAGTTGSPKAAADRNVRPTGMTADIPVRPTNMTADRNVRPTNMPPRAITPVPGSEGSLRDRSPAGLPAGRPHGSLPQPLADDAAGRPHGSLPQSMADSAAGRGTRAVETAPAGRAATKPTYVGSFSASAITPTSAEDPCRGVLWPHGPTDAVATAGSQESEGDA